MITAVPAEAMLQVAACIYVQLRREETVADDEQDAALMVEAWRKARRLLAMQAAGEGAQGDGS